MSQPPQYENAGIRFRYPENWRIVEEQSDGLSETVFAQSPGSGFWMLQHFPAQQEANDLTDNLLQTLRTEYGEIEVEESQQTVLDVDLTGHDLHFFCMDMVVVARTRRFSLGNRCCLLLCQAEDREFSDLELVFDAITTSLISETQDLS